MDVGYCGHLVDIMTGQYIYIK